MRRDRYGETVEDDDTYVQPSPHRCDRGWIERTDGRVTRCPTCQPEPRLSEKAWQQRVTDLSRLRGWLVFHPLNSRGSTPGWPDLCLVRDGRLIFTELKTDTGRVTRDQHLWLDRLAACHGVTAHVWRPADWPTVQATLR